MHNKVKYAEINKANELFKKEISESDGHPHKMWQVINEPTSNKSSRSSLKE